VWPKVIVEENTLQAHMSALRKILGSDAIATISRRGYRFTPEVTPVGATATTPTPNPRHNLPLLVMGGGAGRIKGGRHLTYSDKPTMANLLVTLMDKMDVPVERIGGSTGKLPLDTLSGV